MSNRDELLKVMLDADEAHGPEGSMWPELADAILAAGYRKIFDGECGLSNVEDPTDREAAEAWMRWANLAMNEDVGAIYAMKKMLTELGYRKAQS